MKLSKKREELYTNGPKQGRHSASDGEESIADDQRGRQGPDYQTKLLGLQG